MNDTETDALIDGDAPNRWIRSSYVRTRGRPWCVDAFQVGGIRFGYAQPLLPVGCRVHRGAVRVERASPCSRCVEIRFFRPQSACHTLR